MAKLDHCCMFTQQPGQIQRHWLSCTSVERKQWEASSAARFSSCQIECDAIQFRWVRDPGKQAWMAGVSLSSTSRCTDFLISTQIAKMPENIWSRPSIIPEKILGAFPQHPQPKKCHCPRSCCCSMRICSRIFSAQPGIAFPSKSPMPCSPHQAWMNFLSFLRASKIENQKIPKSKESQWHHPVHC